MNGDYSTAAYAYALAGKAHEALGDRTRDYDDALVEYSDDSATIQICFFFEPEGEKPDMHSSPLSVQNFCKESPFEIQSFYANTFAQSSHSKRKVLQINLIRTKDVECPGCGSRGRRINMGMGREVRCEHDDCPVATFEGAVK